MSGFATVQNRIAAQLGSSTLSAATSSIAPTAGQTTTAVNMLIVVNNNVQGLIKNLTYDESYDYHREKAISSAVPVAFIPGVYEANGSIEKLFLFGETIDAAFGAGLRAVTGTQQTTADPSQLYFNIVTVDNQGNALQTFHDCVLIRARRSTDIDSVIIVDNIDIWMRWSAL